MTKLGAILRLRRVIQATVNRVFGFVPFTPEEVAQAQKLGGVAAYVDAEHAVDRLHADRALDGPVDGRRIYVNGRLVNVAVPESLPDGDHLPAGVVPQTAATAISRRARRTGRPSRRT